MAVDRLVSVHRRSIEGYGRTTNPMRAAKGDPPLVKRHACITWAMSNCVTFARKP